MLCHSSSSDDDRCCCCSRAAVASRESCCAMIARRLSPSRTAFLAVFVCFSSRLSFSLSLPFTRSPSLALSDSQSQSRSSVSVCGRRCPRGAARETRGVSLPCFTLVSSPLLISVSFSLPLLSLWLPLCFALLRKSLLHSCPRLPVSP